MTTSDKMKAAIFQQYGNVDVLEIADIPKPSPKHGEILVQVKAAAVNPKDTFIRKGRFTRFTGNQFPKQVGFDFAGDVVETHSKDYQIGDAVFGMLDGWQGATCAEYVTAPTDQIAKKAETVSYEAAAAVPLVALTALQALRDEANIKEGNAVCINGASGGVGTMAVQIAKLYGAQVTAIASAKNHEFLYELGADSCVDYREQDITKTNKQFDIFFDVFGNTRFAYIKAILKKNGTWVSTVLKRHVFVSTMLSKFSSKKAKLIVVKSNTDDLQQIANWMNESRLKAIIHDIYPLTDIQAAHKQQESKHTRGKIVIKM